jgi:hypothetical protein
LREEEAEEEVVEAEEIRGIFVDSVLTNITVVKKLGGSVVDLLHESF